MKNIHRWTANRSGPAITITGDDDQGAAVKITGVKAISADALWPIATDEHGQSWRLLPANYAQIRAAIAASVSPSELVGFLGEDEDELEMAEA